MQDILDVKSQRKIKLLKKLEQAQIKNIDLIVRNIFSEYPDDAALLSALAEQCFSLENISTAKKAINQILKLDPLNYAGHYLFAKLLFVEGQYAEAYSHLAPLIPHDRLSIHDRFLAYSLLHQCCHHLCRAKEYMQQTLQIYHMVPDAADRAKYYSASLMLSNYIEDLSNEEIYQMHIKYNELFKNIVPYTHAPSVKKQKIKVAYISADFRVHTAMYFSYQLLSKYNKEKFTVTCYARNKPNHLTEELKNLVDCWRDISDLSVEEAARFIYEDNIDILFDLSGHTDCNCLPILAWKPAPIQISGIGYTNTTGLAAIDYFLTDIHCTPPDQTCTYFSEKPIRLPHSHFCYTPPNTMPEIDPTGRRSQNTIVFGSFNNLLKITDSQLEVWLKILTEVPNAKLLLKSPHFDIQQDRIEILNRAFALGFKESQIEMRAATSDYLLEYNDIDIALDTFPYQGGGTTFEALHMGIPVVTLVGKRHGTRFGYSILKNIGFEDGIAFSEEEYINCAVRLAQNRPYLEELHQTLRMRMVQSPLMDGRLYLNDLETAYTEIWSIYQSDKIVY